MIALTGLLLIITEQYLQPTITNSLRPLRELNWAHMIGAQRCLPWWGFSVCGGVLQIVPAERRLDSEHARMSCALFALSPSVRRACRARA